MSKFYLDNDNCNIIKSLQNSSKQDFTRGKAIQALLHQASFCKEETLNDMIAFTEDSKINLSTKENALRVINKSINLNESLCNKNL